MDFGTLERYPRKSAYFYKEVIRTNSLDIYYEPENFTEARPSAKIKTTMDEDNELI